MAKYRAVAAGGKWSEILTWEDEIEGIFKPATVVPTANDDVQLLSTSGSVTISAEALCRSLDATNYANTLTFEAARVLKIGTTSSNAGLCLKLGAGMTLSVPEQSNLFRPPVPLKKSLRRVRRCRVSSLKVPVANGN